MICPPSLSTTNCSCNSSIRAHASTAHSPDKIILSNDCSIAAWSHLPSVLPWSPKHTQRPTRFPSPHSITPRLLRYLWWDNSSAVNCIKKDGIDDVQIRHNMNDNGHLCLEQQLLHHLVTAGASLGHLTSSALSSAVIAAITGPWIVKFVQVRYICSSQLSMV